MEEGGTQELSNEPLEEYKALETRLYGELIKSCRRYSSKLSIISITGILDIIKQEIMELEKTNLKFMKSEISEDDESFQRMM